MPAAASFTPSPPNSPPLLPSSPLPPPPPLSWPLHTPLSRSHPSLPSRPPLPPLPTLPSPPLPYTPGLPRRSSTPLSTRAIISAEYPPTEADPCAPLIHPPAHQQREPALGPLRPCPSQPCCQHCSEGQQYYYCCLHPRLQARTQDRGVFAGAHPHRHWHCGAGAGAGGGGGSAEDGGWGGPGKAGSDLQLPLLVQQAA